MDNDALDLSVVFSGFQQGLLLNGCPFKACIYSGSQPPSDKFNAVLLTLDASMQSRLNWSAAIEQARELVKQGFYILWELQFNLYADSLADEGRFSALKLGVDHFSKTVWPFFQSQTLGVILHRGSLDFSDTFPWTIEEEESFQNRCDPRALFCRDVMIDYLKLLAASLPIGLCCFILLDGSSITDPFLFFQLTNRASMASFQLILKGALPQQFPFAFPFLGWDHGFSPLGFLSETPYEPLSERKVNQAILLPSQGGKEELKKVLSQLSNPFQVIPESLLTQQWEGVEELFVFSDSLDDRIKRKVLGFCAAEGKIFTIGPSLDLLQES
ncbi:MAG: hypothetical protein WAM28_01100 [Chlamydiales bacterium]